MGLEKSHVSFTVTAPHTRDLPYRGIPFEYANDPKYSENASLFGQSLRWLQAVEALP